MSHVRLTASAALLVALLLALASPAAPQKLAPLAAEGKLPASLVADAAPVLGRVQPDDALTRDGFVRFYNTDYDGAIRDFREELRARPDDPRVVNHLMEAVLGAELEREGALDAALYMGTRFLKLTEPPADVKVKEELDGLARRALTLSNQRLASHPDDARALYARGVTRGLRATYTAVVEKRWLGALRGGLAAYGDHERLLRLDPSNSDAKLIVGTYQYIAGSLPWWVRLLAFLADVHGSKTRGFELLRAAASGGGEASVDAKTILALFLAREKRYDEATSLIRELAAAFPHNFVFALAEGELAAAAGKRREAAALFERLVASGRAGEFPNAHVELAADELGRTWAAEKEYARAAAAFESVETIPHANPAVVSRARLQAGEMYDLLGQRHRAIAKYSQVVASGSADAPAARRLLRHPYRAP